VTKKTDDASQPDAAPSQEPVSVPGVLTEAEASAIAYRYVGNGDQISGIPPRDLTVIDIENLDLGLRREVYVGRLYQAV
jgi:hypothetical protein